MRRRKAIRNIGIISAGLALLPSCGDRLLLAQVGEKAITFSDQQQIWLNALSEAILPKSDLTLTTYEPFPDFISKMITHLDQPEEQISFGHGYNNCTEEIRKLYNSNVEKITPEEIIDYFQSLLNQEDEQLDLDTEEGIKLRDTRYFSKKMRDLSIWHLKTSKEYQEEILEYKLIPDQWESCIPV